MKKIILFLIMLLPSMAFAENVTVERARKIAENFLKNHSNSRSSEATLSLVWDGEPKHSRSSKYNPAYYVFESSTNSFVIVAGDDIVNPILGYSKESGFDVDNMPENLKWWMDELRGGINYLRENKIQTDKETQDLWNDAVSDTRVSRAVESEKLLKTANWNQEYPYNKMCPTIDGKNTLVGCTPTAMAIMMRYYQWPKSGSGYVEGYQYTDDTGITRTIEGYSLGHEYDWDNMPLDFNNYTQAQADAVAQLMRDCAVIAQAEFNLSGIGGTSANIRNAWYGVIKHMSYSANTFLYEKNMFTNSEWRKMMFKSINDNHPIWYRGESKTGSGHNFIVDGYDCNGLFHINFGWEGYYNGYFSFPNFYKYSKDHKAIMGLKKDEGGESLEVIGLVRNSSNTCKGIYFSDGDDYQVVKGVPFEITFGRLSNRGNSVFNGLIAIVVVDKEGKQKEILRTFSRENVTPNYGWNSISRKCTVTQEIEIGDRIKLFYKSDRSDEWEPVWYVKEEGFVGELPIADEYYIEEVTSFKYKVEQKLIEIKTKPDASWSFYNQYGTSITQGITFDEGNLHIDISILSAGTYTLILSKGKDIKKVKFIIGGE